MLMLSRLGLRAGEVAGLGLDDIDWRHGEITVRGKGNRAERLPLPVDVGAGATGRHDRTADARGAGVTVHQAASKTATPVRITVDGYRT
jgi:integrase/recombinase XerD